MPLVALAVHLGQAGKEPRQRAGPWQPQRRRAGVQVVKEIDVAEQKLIVRGAKDKNVLVGTPGQGNDLAVVPIKAAHMADRVAQE